MMVPIQVIRWYRMQCYDGTDSCAIVVPFRRYCHFGIPSELKGFTDLAKRVTSNKDTRFTNLFAAIKNAPEMRMFKDVLKYLLENNYNTDDLELVRMVNEYVN